MTEQEYRTARTENSQLNNGQFLSMAIIGILGNMDLTLLEAMMLQNIESNGTFQPSDKQMFPSILEILQLSIEDKKGELFAMLKKLPQYTPETQKRVFTLDGKKCSRGVFFNRDLYPGERKILNDPVSNKPFKDMTLEESRNSYLYSFRGGEELAREIIGDDAIEHTFHKKRLKGARATPIPKSEESSDTEEPYLEDEFSNNIYTRKDEN